MAATDNLGTTTSIYTDFKHGGMLLGTSGSFVTMSWSSGHSLSHFAVYLSLTNTDVEGLDHPISVYTRHRHGGTEYQQYFLNKFWIPSGTTFNVFTRSSPFFMNPGSQTNDFLGLYWAHTNAGKIHAHVDWMRNN